MQHQQPVRKHDSTTAQRTQINQYARCETADTPRRCKKSALHARARSSEARVRARERCERRSERGCSHDAYGRRFTTSAARSPLRACALGLPCHHGRDQHSRSVRASEAAATHGAGAPRLLPPRGTRPPAPHVSVAFVCIVQAYGMPGEPKIV